jgi:D-tyrosyl-tRNA(Tyr) deacylase
MRAVIQRVSRARVVVEGRVTGEIEAGLLVLVAAGREDTAVIAASIAEKIVNLRIFATDDHLSNDPGTSKGKMNRSLLDTGGAILAVPQFTLYGDVRGQRRPSFMRAAPPEEGKILYDNFVNALKALGVRVETGVFQAHMSVELVNDGPVTILIDSEKIF